jgi:hypothetical protein
VAPHVAEHELLGLGQRDPVRQLGQQPGGGVHLADHLRHRLQGFRRRFDDQVYALVKQGELAVGHQARDLDERVAFDVEPGHLAVDPHEPVIHVHRVWPWPACVASKTLFAERSLLRRRRR